MDEIALFGEVHMELSSRGRGYKLYRPKLEVCSKCGKKGVTERFEGNKVTHRCRYCKDCNTHGGVGSILHVGR